MRILVWLVAFFLAGTIGYVLLNLFSFVKLSVDPPYPNWEFRITDFFVPLLNQHMLLITYHFLASFFLIPFLFVRVIAETREWWSLRASLISGGVISIVGTALTKIIPGDRWGSLDESVYEFLTFGVLGVASGAAYFCIENGLWRLSKRPERL